MKMLISKVCDKGANNVSTMVCKILYLNGVPAWSTTQEDNGSSSSIYK